MNRPSFRLAPLLLTLLLPAACGRELPVGTVAVVSDPPGAAIVVDGTATGDRTPADLLLDAGYHIFSVHLPDHASVPAVRSLRVAPAQRLTAGFTLTGIGRIVVTSQPAGGAILLDGAPTDRTTPDTLQVAAGSHTVQVVAGGLVAEEGTMDVLVATGGVTEASFTLVPAGTLQVTGTPVSAEVVIDDLATGRETPAAFLLPAGRHVVRVRREGWAATPDSQVVDLAAGADTTIAFQLVETGQTGTLQITSAPPGAEIVVDGEPTGVVTPAVIDVTAGSHTVTVHHDLFRPLSPVTVTVGAAQVTAHDFVLAARRVALVETFSSVNCIGCPDMNAMLDEIVATGGVDRDRMVAIKYSQGWLGPDPHYAVNPADNDARAQFYYENTAWDGSLPTLLLDGILTVAPSGFPDYAQMLTLLETSNATDTGFAVQVDVSDFATPLITATVTLLTAVPPASTADLELDAVLVESPVRYQTPPGSEGETEFHWIMRDFVRLTEASLVFDPAVPDTHTVQFTNDVSWVDANLLVVAFVQNRSTLAVLQAGSTAAADAAVPDDTPQPTQHPTR